MSNIKHMVSADYIRGPVLNKFKTIAMHKVYPSIWQIRETWLIVGKEDFVACRDNIYVVDDTSGLPIKRLVSFESNVIR